MAMNSKGYVLTPVKDVMHVLAIIERVIYDLIQQNIITRAEEGGYRFPAGFNYASSSVSPAAATADTRFTLNGEARTLSIYFTCDGDPVLNYKGQKLVLMMGSGGLANTVIPKVLAKLTHLGDCYFDTGSLEDVPLVHITTAPMTFVDAVRGRFERAPNVDQWVGYHSRVGSKLSLREYLGLTAEEFVRFTADPDAIGEICKARVALANAVVTQ